MSLLTSRAVRALYPGSLCALCALLLALLLFTPGSLASAGPVSANIRELRCVCLTTKPRIHPQMIKTLQIIPAGPQCPTLEVVATLKNGKGKVCLDPEAPLIKKGIQKILDSSANKKN